MSAIIPKVDISIGKREWYRQQAIEKGITEALNYRIAVNREQLTFRQWRNVLDAGTALEQWNTAALAVVGTEYSVFQAVAVPVLAPTKLAVAFRCGVETTPFPVSRLVFRALAANGNILSEYDLEQLVNCQETEGYFDQPQVIPPNQAFACNVVARIATGALARVQLGIYVIERLGGLIA